MPNIVKEISVKQDTPTKQTASIKQDSKNAGSVKTFKDTMDNVASKDTDTNTNKNNDNSKVSDSNKKEVSKDGKIDKTDKNDEKETADSKEDYKNISALLSQLMDGKIDLSKLSDSVKQDIVSVIQSKLGSSAVNDEKLSAAVTNLINSLTSKNEGTKVNVSQLLTTASDNPLAAFNDDIAKLLEANTSKNAENLNINDSIKNIIKDIDKSLISTLNTEASKTNTAALPDSYENILSTLKPQMADQSKTTSKAEDIKLNQVTEVKVNADSSAVNKTVKNDLQQDSKNSTAGEEKKSSVSVSLDKEKSTNKSSGDDFLNKLLSSDDKNSKFSRVSSFMTQFNNFKTDMPVIQDGSIVVNKVTVGDDMVKAIKYMDVNGIKDITVKIMPKELGEVVVKLTMENGEMKANITASNKEAYNLLSSNLKDIADKLQTSDIKIQNFNINIYNEDTTFFRDNSNSQSQQGYKQKQSGSSVKEIADEKTDNSNENLEFSDDNALNALV